MGKGPRAPDPTAVINAQKDANRINTYGPYGASIFGSIDDAGQFVPRTGGDAIMTQETPFQKMQREQQENLFQQLGGIAQQRAGSLSPDPFSLPNAPAYQGSIDRSGLAPIRDYSGDIQRGYAGLDTSGLQGISGQGDFAGERQRIEDATFNRQKRLMDPGFQQSRERLAQDLANRGMPIGSEASNRALDRLDRSQGQAMADLTDRSVALGGQEFARRQQQQMALRGQQFGERQAAFGAGQQQAGFANQSAQLANALAMGARGARAGELLQDQQMNNAARANQIQESLLQRNQRTNELAQLMGAAPQQPLPQTAGAAPIDAMGPLYQQYQGDLANYQSNVGAGGDLLSLLGLYGLSR